jgi:hypothetical protein
MSMLPHLTPEEAWAYIGEEVVALDTLGTGLIIPEYHGVLYEVRLMVDPERYEARVLWNIGGVHWTSLNFIAKYSPPIQMELAKAEMMVSDAWMMQMKVIIDGDPANINGSDKSLYAPARVLRGQPAEWDGYSGSPGD